MEPRQTKEPLLSNMSHNNSEQISAQSFSQHDQFAHQYPANLDSIYASKSTGCLTKVLHPGLSAIKSKSIGSLKLENSIITNESVQGEMFAQHFPTNLDSIYALRRSESLTKMLHPGLSAIKAKSIGCLKRENSTITDSTAQEEIPGYKQNTIVNLNEISPSKARSEINLDKQRECGANRSSTPQIKSKGDLLYSQCVRVPVCEQENIKSTSSNNGEGKSNDEIVPVSMNKNESKYIEKNEIKSSLKSTELYSQVKLRSVHTMRPKSSYDSEHILSSVKRSSTGDNVDSTRDHIEDMSNEIHVPTEVALKIKAAEALISKLADSTGILKTKKTTNKENKVNDICHTEGKCIKLELENSKEFGVEPCNNEQTDCTGVIKTKKVYEKYTKFYDSSTICDTKMDLEVSKVITTEYSIRGQTDVSDILKTNSPSKKENEFKAPSTSERVNTKVDLETSKLITTEDCIREQTGDSEILKTIPSKKPNEVKDPPNSENISTEVGLETSELIATEDCFRQQTDVSNILNAYKPYKEENKVMAPSTSEEISTVLDLEASKFVATKDYIREQTDISEIFKTNRPSREEIKEIAPPATQSMSTKVEMDTSKLVATENCTREQSYVSDTLKSRPSIMENKVMAPSTSEDISTVLDLEASKLVATVDCMREQTDISDTLKSRPSKMENKVKAPSNSGNISTILDLVGSKFIATEECIREHTDGSESFKTNVSLPSKKEQKVKHIPIIESTSIHMYSEDASKVFEAEACILKTDCTGILKTDRKHRSRKETKVAASKSIHGKSTEQELEGTSKPIAEEPYINDKKPRKGILKTNKACKRANRVDVASCIEGLSNKLNLDGTSNIITRGECIEDQSKIKQPNFSNYPEQLKTESISQHERFPLQYHENSDTIYASKSTGILLRVPDSGLTALKAKSDVSLKLGNSTDTNSTRHEIIPFYTQKPAVNFNQLRCFTKVRSEITLDKQNERRKNRASNLETKSEGDLSNSQCVVTCEQENVMNSPSNKSKRKGKEKSVSFMLDNIEGKCREDNEINTSPARIDISTTQHKLRHKSLHESQNGVSSTKRCHSDRKVAASSSIEGKGNELHTESVLETTSAEGHRPDQTIFTTMLKTLSSMAKKVSSSLSIQCLSNKEHLEANKMAKKSHSLPIIESMSNNENLEGASKLIITETSMKDQTYCTKKLKTKRASKKEKKVGASLSTEGMSNNENLEGASKLIITENSMKDQTNCTKKLKTKRASKKEKKVGASPSTEGMSNNENLEGDSKLIIRETSMKDQTNCTKRLKTNRTSKKEKKVGTSPSTEGMSNNENLEGASKSIRTETAMEDQSDCTKKRKTKRSSKKEKKVGTSPSIEGTSNTENLEGTSELITTETFMEGQTDSTKKRKTKRSPKTEKKVGAPPRIDVMSNNANLECASNSIRPTAEVTIISDNRDGTRKPKTSSASKKEKKVSLSSSIEGVSNRENQDSDSKLCLIEIDTTDQIACTGESETNRSTSKENKITVPSSIEGKGDELHSEGVRKTITAEGHRSDQTYSTSTLKIISASEMAKKAYSSLSIEGLQKKENLETSKMANKVHSSPSIEGLRNKENLEEASNNISTEVAIINDHADCTKKLRAKTGSKKEKKVSASHLMEGKGNNENMEVASNIVRPTAEMTIINDQTDYARNPKTKSSTRKENKINSSSSIRGDRNKENLVGTSKFITTEMSAKDETDSTSMLKNISTSKMTKKAHSSPCIEGLSNQDNLEASKKAKKCLSSPSIEVICYKGNLESAPNIITTEVPMEDQTDFSGLLKTNGSSIKEKEVNAPSSIEGMRNKEDLASDLITTEAHVKDQADLSGMLKTNSTCRIVSTASSIECLRHKFQTEGSTKSSTAETSINDQAGCSDMLITISASQKEKKVNALSTIEGIGNKEDLAGASKTIAAEATNNDLKQYDENLPMNAHNETEKLKQRLRHRKIQTENLRALLRTRENQLCACADDMIHLKTRLLGREKTIIRLCEMFLKLKSKRDEQLHGRPGVSIAWKYGSETVDQQHLF